MIFVTFIIAPLYTQRYGGGVSDDIRQKLPSFLRSFIQPNKQNNNYTGENAEDYVFRAVPEVTPMRTVA